MMVAVASPGSRNAITPTRPAPLPFSAPTPSKPPLFSGCPSTRWPPLTTDASLEKTTTCGKAWGLLCGFTGDALLHDCRTALLRILRWSQNKGMLQQGTERVVTRGITLRPLWQRALLCVSTVWPQSPEIKGCASNL